MAGIVSSVTNVDFLNVSKACPQPTFNPKVSSVSFTSSSRYSKGRIQATTSEESKDSGAHGIIDEAAKNANAMVDKAKELAEAGAAQAESNEAKKKESEDKVLKATKDAAESAAEAAEETAGGMWEAAKGTVFPKADEEKK
ncbi:hypothetical protein DCAR_0104333 [Daucus carota subsp. sativus]|uniref:Uncharacterized protein n=1 Tax=Daucus carota subsp. sativus TaxID=79200 RepID=A0A166IRE8_DAUCS|nr:PREDICTED: uncharacterized protein LOC108197308 [Daucus carota subsp. sativus]WOG85146.1 hypothetical protein DCAR_0104333 [Daucus carota subsp. sativus]